MAILIFAAVCFLAYSNGANDNFKGVASLLGSRTASYKTALWWATAATLLGSVCSFFLATSLLSKFTGKGIVPDQLAGSEHFLFAVAFGAGATIILATLTGFPVSTTHGLTGAIVGAGLVAGGNVSFAALQNGFLLPLLVSPVVAVALGSVLYGAALYGAAHFLRVKAKAGKETCVCVGNQFVPITISGGGAMAFQAGAPTVSIDETKNCVERYDGNFFGFSLQNLIDYGHFLSAGVVCFARGLNDTPKIVALLAAAQVFHVAYGFAVVAAAIVGGGLLNARKVAEKMSYQITEMNSGQAFAANLATGILVILASNFALPVSTTHVSVGSLFGIGLMTRQANFTVVSGILLSWLVTLPCAAAIAAVSFFILEFI